MSSTFQKHTLAGIRRSRAEQDLSQDKFHFVLLVREIYREAQQQQHHQQQQQGQDEAGALRRRLSIQILHDYKLNNSGSAETTIATIRDVFTQSLTLIAGATFDDFIVNLMSEDTLLLFDSTRRDSTNNQQQNCAALHFVISRYFMVRVFNPHNGVGECTQRAYAPFSDMWKFCDQGRLRKTLANRYSLLAYKDLLGQNVPIRICDGAGNDAVKEVSDRHCVTTSGDRWKYNPDHFMESIKSSTDTVGKIWEKQQQAKSVLVIAGASGSGKTIEGIFGIRHLLEELICKNNQRGITSSSSSSSAPDSNTNSQEHDHSVLSNSKIFSFYFLSSAVDAHLSLPHPSSSSSGSKDSQLGELDNDTRDDIVRKAILSLMSTALRLKGEQQEQQQQQGALPFVEISDGGADVGNYHVIITIDEIGARPNLLRGLCACCSKLCKDLHSLLRLDPVDVGHGSGSTPTSSSSPRVYLVAAGTGASSADSGTELASHTATFSCVYLSSSRAVFLSLLDEYFKSLRNQNENANSFFFDRVQTLQNRFTSLCGIDKDTLGNKESTTTSTTLTAPQRLFQDFVTNSRCGALLLRAMTIGEIEHMNWECDRSFDLALHRWILAASVEYMQLNALQSAISPKAILLMAFAVSALRIPLLPTDLEYLRQFVMWRPVTPFGPGTPEVDSNLVNILCTKGGILVDHAKPVESSDYQARSKNEIRLQEIVGSSDQLPSSKSPNNPARVHFVIRTNASRFEFSPAFLAMLRLQCKVQLLDNLWTFERRTGELVLFLAAASEFTKHLLLASQNKSTTSNIKDNPLRDFAHKYHRENDEMYKLKYEWIHFPDYEIVDATVEQFRNTTLSNVVRAATARFHQASPSSSFDLEQNVIEYHNKVFCQALAEPTNKKTIMSDDAPTSPRHTGYDYIGYLKESFQLDKSINNDNNNDGDSVPHRQEDDSTTATKSHPKGRVLVCHSIANESFADIIVLAPKKVILLQCKHFPAASFSSDVNVADEFGKMGVPYDHTDVEQDSTKLEQLIGNSAAGDGAGTSHVQSRIFLRHLRRMCAEDPFDDESINAVQVCCGIVIESGSGSSPDSSPNWNDYSKEFDTLKDRSNNVKLAHQEEQVFPLNHHCSLNFELGFFSYSSYDHDNMLCPIYPFQADAIPIPEELSSDSTLTHLQMSDCFFSTLVTKQT